MVMENKYFPMEISISVLTRRENPTEKVSIPGLMEVSTRESFKME